MNKSQLINEEYKRFKGRSQRLLIPFLGFCVAFATILDRLRELRSSTSIHKHITLLHSWDAAMVEDLTIVWTNRKYKFL